MTNFATSVVDESLMIVAGLAMRLKDAWDRKALVYCTFPSRRDTTSSLKYVLDQAGLKVAVLSSVDTSRREDWFADQVEKGIDVLITNPELVSTGLDFLDFPMIAFMQTGWNVYTLQQAARRSWRIGQHRAVRVVFFGYAETSQIACLRLMASKIAVTQSTSGDTPESGIDALKSDGESDKMELAAQMVARSLPTPSKFLPPYPVGYKYMGITVFLI